MSQQINLDILTPAEQRIYEERLAALKKQYTESRTLTAKASELRQKIIDERGKQRKEPAPPFPVREKLLTLPGIVPVIPEPQMSPLSNWLAKTSIFAPRPPGARRDTGSEWVSLASPRGVNIFYNGPELDMADHTLYLHLVKLAEGRAPNEIIYINRAEILKKCGYKNIGKSAYVWLNAAFDRLMQANMRIVIDNTALEQSEDKEIFGSDVNAIEEIGGRKVKKLRLTLKIMGELAESTDTGDYYYTLPPTCLILFANQLYGYNDLLKRNSLQKGGRADLAAWLQGYVCADHPGEHHPVLVETLWKHSGSKSRLGDFIKRLRLALDNCKQAKIIQSWEIYQNEKGKTLLFGLGRPDKGRHAGVSHRHAGVPHRHAGVPHRHAGVPHRHAGVQRPYGVNLW